jgi:Cd2+/Zn2+-exporting ATPase
MILKLKIKDLDCMDCARGLERLAKTIEGVEDAKVSFALSTLELKLRHEGDKKAVVRRLERKGYEVFPLETAAAVGLGSIRGAVSRRRMLLTSMAGAFLLGALALRILGVQPHWTRLMLIGATASALPLTLVRGLYALRSRQIDMNVLMSVAIVAAAVIGHWEEAGTVSFLFSVAIILESLAMVRTRRAIESLMELSPDKAMVRRQGSQLLVDASEVSPGDTIIIKPGERIPLEGEVVSGITSVDESPITGEPMPAPKQPGSKVFAGTLNEQGLIEVTVTKPKEESTLARIVHLVEHVEESKAPVERLVDRFARVYTPAVVAGAILMGAIPHILGMPGPWIHRSLVILIIACPCALVIATPVAIVSGITSAARKGILIKGGAHLEQASRVKGLALDKTGTLTWGRPRVSLVSLFGDLSQDRLLAIAAAVESASTHPLAGAILAEARRRGIHWSQPKDVTSTAGSGVSANIDGTTYHVAKPEFFMERLPGLPDALKKGEGKTVVAVGTNSELLGLIEFTDEVRPGTAETLAAIKKLGILRTIMITGDREETARDVARTLGVDAYQADLLPEQKVKLVNDLKEQFDVVAMVGDGVNDAPALAAAHVGIAMGAAGSDIAIDTATVALMSDDITKLRILFKIAKAVGRIIRENIALAVGIKAIFLVLAAMGRATMWMAVFADMGASLIVIANALRLLSDGSAAFHSQSRS